MKNNNINHLTLDERELIEQYLLNFNKDSLNFTIIGNSLNKHPSTIAKEIKKHRIHQPASKYNNLSYNMCAKKYTCSKKNVCNTGCKNSCKDCEYCNLQCIDFVKLECKLLSKPPYVCNACETKGKCMYEKYFYRASNAQKEYRSLLSEARSGLNMTWSEFNNYQNIVKKGTKLGQSLYHIKNANPEIPFEVSTMYQHVEKNWIDIKNIDLVRKVKLKPRKQTLAEKKKIILRKNGRSYDDFQNYLLEHPFTSVIEMDTVIGKRDEEPVLLTFLHRDSNLFWAFIIEKKTSQCVAEKINEYYEKIGHEYFKEFCPVILTDNGSEFENPEAIEYTLDGKERTKVFYCRPMRSGDKGKLEQTHTLVRRVLPKGTSFVGLTQDKVTLMCNHINNYLRKELNGCTPYKLATVVIKKKILNTLNLHEIPVHEVNLKPSLLKH